VGLFFVHLPSQLKRTLSFNVIIIIVIFSSPVFHSHCQLSVFLSWSVKSLAVSLILVKKKSVSGPDATEGVKSGHGFKETRG